MVQKGPTTGFRSIHFRLVVAGEAGAVVALQSGLEPRDKKNLFRISCLLALGKKEIKPTASRTSEQARKNRKGEVTR